MTKISIYQIDDYVTADDKWIGTDVNTYNKTKNFTPRKVAKYFNENEVINTSNSIRYRYDTIAITDSRKQGTLSFETEIGSTVPIDTITTFILSKDTQGGKDVSNFLNVLPTTKVILQKADNIDIFGLFRIVSVNDYIVDPGFFVVTLEFLSGNGSLEEDKDYIISLIDLQNVVQIPQLIKETFDYNSSNSFTLSNVINNVLQVIVNTTSLHPEAYSYTLPSTVTILNELYTGDVITIVYNYIEEFLEVPDLQRVTDEGSVTTNSITADAFIKSGGISTEYLMADGSINSDILVKKTGDTMLGDLILNEDPSTALGAATKQYVDNISSGINFHFPVVVATDVSLVATYDNGVDGVGATLTGPSVGVLSIDGETPSYLDRVLVWQQADPIENGIYDLTTVGDSVTVYQLTRSSDADNSPPGEIHYGDYTLVLSGDTNGGFGFICNTPGVITIGVTPISYIQFNSAQAVTAGYGLEELNPNVISIDPLVTQEKITLTTTGSGAATLVSNTLNIPTLPQATSSVSGYLSSIDFTTFNGKANVNSQVFTGTPSLPTGTIGVTQVAGTNNTTLATTAFATTALNGKMNNPSLTASYIPKALTATTIGNSRLLDTGTYLGIGTVNAPTKDITLGNQDNREVGIEESTNIVVGRDLTINAGRTVNYVPSTGFIRLNLLQIEYYGADSLSNGDILITGNGNIVYKLVAGSPPFVNYGTVPIPGPMISVHPTNDNIIYSVSINISTSIYISTNGGVSFSAIPGITSRNYRYVKIMPNGDAYATISDSGDIYKRTGGTGDFIAMGFTSKLYQYIISTPSGDAYFPVAGDDIYKINSGTSVLTALGQTFRNWANGYFLNGDLYIAVGGTSYKQTALAGNFVLNTLFTYPVNPLGVFWNVTVSKTTNNVYVPSYNNDVWVQYNNGEGTVNLKGGTLKLNSGTGKGTGASDIEMWTGQVLSSGTTMQTSTLRAKINNTGLMTLPSVTNTLIDADSTGKAVATKEYVNNRLVVETTSGYTLTNADSGGIVIFKTTASQTLTIPTGLADGFECTFVTLSGVTLTVVSTGNTLNNATSTTMLPQLSFTLKRMLAANTYIVAGSL